ncbi:hypothetical protein GC106_1260 [Kibdelosporangium sp. 4NS15]|uniref:Excreted virulence factor EspC, type VII ESX diderm n=1 Tax=Kibdelosporangium persicum TaxID=2698649 RepID=A0ABX2EW28_9PSEU|nr:hypothetical protein [Kibdelosporangium persicum]NRN62925.1 hypothetical protein [Kibdelosporangium persicum]
MGYQVVIDSLRKASSAAADAAAQAGKVQLGAAIDDVGPAMPGSRSGPAAASLATAWTSQVKNWSSDAQAYSENLTKAADHYAANEQAAKADFEGLG